MLPLIIFIIPFFVGSLLLKIYRRLFVVPISLEEKVVLVTGASGGLGEAIAKRFSSRGAKLILCARDEELLKKVKRNICPEESSEWPLVYPLDITKPEDIEKCVDFLKSRDIFVDILISNAGISQRGSVMETITDVHRRLMNVNYFGQVSLVKAFLPSMLSRKSGSIVSIGSVQGHIAIPFRAAYSASKHASQAFFDSLRAEVAGSNINVSMVNPGYIHTNLSKNALSGDGSKHGVMDPTTASGMPASFVADQVLDCVVYQVNELILADFKSNLAIYLRVIFSPLYFKVMQLRAQSQYKKMKKYS